MATLKARIYEKRKTKDGCTIYINYNHNGKTTKFSTGLKVPARFFSSAKQLVSPKYRKSKEYNDLIKKIKADIEKIIIMVRQHNGDLSGENIKYLYEISSLNDEQKSRHIKNSIKLISCFEEFLAESHEGGHRVKDSRTVKGYKTTLGHIRELGLNPKIQNLGSKYCNELLKHCFQQKLNNSTIQTRIFKDLKTFLNWTIDQGYRKDEFKYKLNLQIIEPPVVFLRQEEINLIKKYNPQTDSENYIKMLIRFLCLTGLRYSDLEAYNSGGIEKRNNGKFWHQIYIPKKKTYEWLPVSQRAVDLIRDFEGTGYSVPVGQVFNRLSKNLCKKAGIDKDMEKNWMSGATLYTDKFKKWERCTAHTFRRTYGRLVYDKTGSILQVMYLLGKSDEKSTYRYIGLEGKDISRAIDDIDA